jgi:hypothetical protein
MPFLALLFLLVILGVILWALAQFEIDKTLFKLIRVVIIAVAIIAVAIFVFGLLGYNVHDATHILQGK